MRKALWWGPAALVAMFALGLAWAKPGLAQQAPAVGSLVQEVARETEVDEEDVKKVLDALGPKLREQLAAGRQVSLPGLGTFRVVRIPEHRDLVQGRPATVPARNYVEFLPDAGLVQGANSPFARPAVTVQPFQYDPLPTQIPGQKVPPRRTPRIRAR